MSTKGCFLSLLWAVFLLTGIALAPRADAAPRALCGFSKQIHQKCDTVNTPQGEKELFRQSFAGLVVSKELEARYPALAASVTKMNQNEWEQAKAMRTSLLEEAREHNEQYTDFFRTFSHESDIQMRRADTLAVSFLRWEYTYTGGTHGNYGWQGVNLDTVTGDPIDSSAIFADTEKLADAIFQQLKKNYPDVPFKDPDQEKHVHELAAQGKLNWVLDPRGVTFIFNPYEIASYAAGALSATILFDERPELFREAYKKTAPAYAEPFPAYSPMRTSLKDDGEMDTIEVFEHEKGIHIKVNKRDNVFDAVLENPEPVLLHTEDGKNYLYIDGRIPDGKRQIFVFRLERNKAHYIDTLPYSFRHVIAVSPEEQEFWEFLTNPDGFFIQKNTTGGSGASKLDTCAIGENGLLTFG